MDKYKEYLAVNVLNESKIVSYRLLSRALKVHCNLAKQMLFEFHATQNAKKPGSVHATYIVTGIKRKGGAITNGTNTQDVDGDSFMRSSPFQSSIPDQDQDRDSEEDVKITSIILTREEDLDEAKSQYYKITSIHIYSLEPCPLKDLQVLSDCNRRIHSEFADEDPLELWKTYGIIHNPNARRRTNKRPAPAPAPIASTATAKTAPTPSTTAIANPKAKEDVKPAKASDSAEASRATTPQVDAAAMPSKKTATKAPSLSRQGSSIFKSFAKAKPKAKKEPSPPVQSAEASAAEDDPMKDVSDDEGENEVIFESSNTSTTLASQEARKAKAEREARLRQMMEDSDDEPMADSPAPAAEEPEEPDNAVEETGLDKQPEPPKKEEQETVTVTDGRRRGRRRVMRKKTVKDEDGYLVTKEEPVWESFSEDEPAPKKVKAPAPSAPAKGKKAAPKTGQGNIMSFFAKK